MTGSNCPSPSSHAFFPPKDAALPGDGACVFFFPFHPPLPPAGVPCGGPVYSEPLGYNNQREFANAEESPMNNMTR